MTHVLIGLGNPGLKYEANRHNAGFMFVEYVAGKMAGSGADTFRFGQKLDSKILQVSIEGVKYILAEPQTYMNLSGEAVQKIMSYYKIPLDSLVVAHDDLDIRLGEYKIQHASGPKLHNGISSIENLLHTKDFNRVRIGIENRPEDIKISGEDYVLSNFTGEEKAVLHTEVFPKIAKQLGLVS